MWEESDREALGVAILHTRSCGPAEAEGARKAVRFQIIFNESLFLCEIKISNCTFLPHQPRESPV